MVPLHDHRPDRHATEQFLDIFFLTNFRRSTCIVVRPEVYVLRISPFLRLR